MGLYLNAAGISEEETISRFNFYLVFPSLFLIVRLIFFIFFYKFDTPLRALLRLDQKMAIENLKVFYDEDNIEEVLEDYDHEASLKIKE